VYVLIAIILGLIEGLTEFLPISSTGHLILAERIIHFPDVEDVFTVVVQSGAIAAVIWYFRKDLWGRFNGLLARRPEDVHFWKLLLVGTVPAGLLGLTVESSMDKIAVPAVVATALIVGGVILWLVDRRPVKKQDERVEWHTISTKRVLLVGLGQSIAIIPGVSRSGATIVSALATGLNRPTATALSFYLSIPVLLAASGLKLVKHGDAFAALPGGSLTLLAGFMGAFLAALLAVSTLLKYIAHHNFKPFAYYRIGLGIVILLLLAVGIL
jgi:undecaprenyl-diphosphatase